MFKDKFEHFTLDEKAWFINTKCNFIGERIGKIYIYFLYEYNELFFEVAWDIKNGELVGVDTFYDTNRLSSYLKDIDIKELKENLS